jgi:hypothetical protein
MKILDFFYFCWSFLPSWIRIRNLNADPDPATQINADPCGSGSVSGSGSETLKELNHFSSYCLFFLLIVTHAIVLYRFLFGSITIRYMDNTRIIIFKLCYRAPAVLLYLPYGSVPYVENLLYALAVDSRN